MKGRSPITAGMMTVVLAALMTGCGSSEPVADDQHAATPSAPGYADRGSERGLERSLNAVGDARALQATINARSQSQ